MLDYFEFLKSLSSRVCQHPLNDLAVFEFWLNVRWMLMRYLNRASYFCPSKPMFWVQVGSNVNMPPAPCPIPQNSSQVESSFRAWGTDTVLILSADADELLFNSFLWRLFPWYPPCPLPPLGTRPPSTTGRWNYCCKTFHAGFTLLQSRGACKYQNWWRSPKIIW